MKQMNVSFHLRPLSVDSEGKSNCVSMCVWEGRVQGWRRRDWVSGPDNQFSFLWPLERGVGMSPSDRTPFPTIKPSKNIPFVSVTAPTHRSHSAMSVDYVALKFTSATDNIISLIMSYGLLPPSDVRSSAHGPFTYSRFSQSLLVRLTGGVLSTFG